jgi:CRP-like cAMP-binding protein
VVEAPVPKDAIVESSAEQKIKMLGKVSAFEYLSYPELIQVINTGELVKVAPGKVICSEGDPGGEMMLLLSGSVHVNKNGQLLRVLGKGDVVGELSLIDAAPRSASIVAKDATNLLAFPREALCALFRAEPTLAVKFLWGLTMETNKRMRMLSNRVVGKPEREGVDVIAPVKLPFHRSR